MRKPRPFELSRLLTIAFGLCGLSLFVVGLLDGSTFSDDSVSGIGFVMLLLPGLVVGKIDVLSLLTLRFLLGQLELMMRWFVSTTHTT